MAKYEGGKKFHLREYPRNGWKAEGVEEKKEKKKGGENNGHLRFRPPPRVAHENRLDQWINPVWYIHDWNFRITFLKDGLLVFWCFVSRCGKTTCMVVTLSDHIRHAHTGCGWPAADTDTQTGKSRGLKKTICHDNWFRCVCRGNKRSRPCRRWVKDWANYCC